MTADSSDPPSREPPPYRRKQSSISREMLAQRPDLVAERVLEVREAVAAHTERLRRAEDRLKAERDSRHEMRDEFRDEQKNVERSLESLKKDVERSLDGLKKEFSDLTKEVIELRLFVARTAGERNIWDWITRLAPIIIAGIALVMTIWKAK